MNKTLANPYYLFSFQHIASKERVSFIPQVITSNVRYDKFRFIEGFNTNLSQTPPQVNFKYIGQYYYSIYEQVSSTNTDPALAYNKLEAGRAVVIVGEDQQQECFYEPYISSNEIFENVIYMSEQEEFCISGDTTPECFSAMTGSCPTFVSTDYPPNLYFNNGGQLGFIYNFDSCLPGALAINDNTGKMYMVDGCSKYYEFDYTITSGGCFNTTLSRTWTIWDSPQFSATPNATYSMAIYDDNTIIVGANASYISQTGSTLYLYDLTTSGLTQWLDVYDNSRTYSVLYNTANTQTILATVNVSTDITYYKLYSGSTSPVELSSITGDTISGQQLYFSGNTPIAVNTAGLQWVLDFTAQTSTIISNGVIPIKYVSNIDGDLNYSGLGDIFQPVSCYTFDLPIPPVITPTMTPTMTQTPSMTPTITPTLTMTPTPSSTPPSNILQFLVHQGNNVNQACNGTPNTFVYAQNLGNCASCLPFNCWPCLTTGQQVFSDVGLTTPVADGYYGCVINGNTAVWHIVGGYPQPGGYTNCP